MSGKSMEKSVSWLEKLLTLQGIETGVSSDLASGADDDSIWLTIDTAPLSEAQVKGLIGDRGKVLDSIQYLANITLNIGQSEADQHSYTIEIDGYRKKRQSELQAIADEAAQKVLNGQEEYAIKGLSSAERRQVHGLMAEYAALETFSRGREPERHLVVKRVRNDDDDSGTNDSEANDSGTHDSGADDN